MTQELWIKEVANPSLKPLNQWREELYGYWMVFSDIQTINGEKMVVARYFGTDRKGLLSKYKELHDAVNEPTVGIDCNRRGNWMGGVFLVKAEG